MWLKKRDHQLGMMMSDAELAWQKGGCGVYVHRHVWFGFDRQTERGEKTLHPTQKPAALWEWVLRDRLKMKPGQTVLDPYCGSGSCGVAALRLGLNYVGIDIESHYVKIAEERLKAAARTLPKEHEVEEETSSRHQVQEGLRSERSAV